MAGNNKPVIVTCLLAILSFFMLFTNAILNWIQKLSTDETVWDKMLTIISLYSNSTCDRARGETGQPSE